LFDVETLSRAQFAFTAAFHYIFPPLTIGLGLILVIMEGIYLKTRDPLFRAMTRFWVRIFGLTFSMGVATGIVLEFEFGTNWAAYSRFVGDVFGSALAAEGIFAFFLESGFLAVLLFGWDKVRPATHFFATLMVALGAHFSAVWIVVANSWQQTPAGFKIVGEGLAARAEITDFWAMVFNPSAMERLSHVIMGAWQAAAFLVLSVSAYYLLRGRHEAFAKASMRVALPLALLASLGQLATGHLSADGVARHQPAKLAAMEGHYEASAPGDLSLFGWVDEDSEKVHGVTLPGMLSFLVHQDRTAPLPGLRSFPERDRPPVNFTFQAYHFMVGIGMGLIGLSSLGVLLWWRGALFTERRVLWLFVFSVLGPQLGNQSGWFTAEVGRQPWIVYGLLRTSDAFSAVVGRGQVLGSLALFGAVYALLGVLFIFLLDGKIRHGPVDEERLAGLEGRRA